MLYNYTCVVCTWWIGASNAAKHAELRQQHVAITRHTPKLKLMGVQRAGIVGHLVMALHTTLTGQCMFMLVLALSSAHY